MQQFVIVLIDIGNRRWKSNVSSNPIYLTVNQGDVLYDITLIDLPDITRNSLKGQAENIHEQIQELIKKYIAPRTAVSIPILFNIV
jgi:hypothetical protein